MIIVMGVMMVAMVAFMWGSHKDRHPMMGGHNNEPIVEEKAKAPVETEKPKEGLRQEEPKNEKINDPVEKI
ncbi:hypothetical protein EPN18_01265 [bacterium]|nr:MAG: hypothetical protein EPN18_01265 [bacterium]